MKMNGTNDFFLLQNYHNENAKSKDILLYEIVSRIIILDKNNELYSRYYQYPGSELPNNLILFQDLIIFFPNAFGLQRNSCISNH